MTYAEKLKDPRWQKKRLQIFERDNFHCKLCGQPDKTLNVYHLIYRKNCDPWEYEMDDLTTLCEDCHKQETLCKQRIDEMIKDLVNYGYFFKDVESLLNSLIYGRDVVVQDFLIWPLAYLFSEPDEMEKIKVAAENRTKENMQSLFEEIKNG